MEHESGREPGQPEGAQATGEPRVDAALAHLSTLGNLPISGHPPIFERIHGQLVEVLGELRADPDPAAHDEISNNMSTDIST